MNLSTSGAWRLPSIFYGLKYSTDKKRVLKAIIDLDSDFIMDVPGIGSFHCRDLASAYQFRPGWEPDIKKEIAQLKDGLFVDVGANIGYYSIMAAKAGNRVIAIEPNHKTFKCLVDSIALNGLTSLIHPIDAAAWSSDSPLKLLTHDYCDTAQISSQGEDVQGLTLDSILGGQVPRLVKIDTEGSEPFVLRGMRKTLRSKPKIIFEALTEDKNQECRQILAHAGYQAVFRLDATNHIAIR